MDFLLPGNCLLCGANSRRSLLCQPCIDDLPTRPDACCPQCGDQSPNGERCGSCLKQAPHFASTRALYRYDFPTDRLIMALKYGHQLPVAAWLGEQLAEQLRGHSCDLIMPLPLHPDRLRQRGFNQSVELARPLSAVLKKPLVLDCLLRTRATPPQAELALKDRARNVHGAFECRQEIADRSILLVDDVMTSGATLNESARVLMLHGARRVDVAVVARAMKH